MYTKIGLGGLVLGKKHAADLSSTETEQVGLSQSAELVMRLHWVSHGLENIQSSPAMVQENCSAMR